MSKQEKPGVLHRVEQLIQELGGRHWKEIADRLRAEGFGEFGTNLLRKKYARWEAKRGDKQADKKLLQEPEKERLEGMTSMIELIANKIFEQPIPEAWMSEIEDHMENILKPVVRRVAQEAAVEALQSISISRAESVGGFEAPPEPERVPGSRRENRDWERLSATIDRNIMKYFNQERKRRRMSTSRFLETILWLHFKKPKLSYEEG